MDLPASLRAVALEQWNLVSGRQLTAYDVSSAQVRWQLRRAWRLVLPGVVMLARDPPTNVQRQMAALLFAGPESWLAGPTAAAALGFLPSEAPQRVHVLGPPSVKPRVVQWVTVRRTYLLDERLVEKGPLRLSCRPRAVIDAAALLPDDVARGMVIDVVPRRLVRLDDLTHWVEARSTRGRPRLRAMVAEAAAGAWSLPEADLAALVVHISAAAAPDAQPAPRGRRREAMTSPDLWFDDVAMAGMVHSRRFHAGSLQWDATVNDDSDCRATGSSSSA